LAWSIPVVTARDESKTGSLIFNVGGVDVSVFFPVDVSFIGQGSLAGVTVASVSRLDDAEGPEYSVDALVTADEYLVV
jgi:coatomer subunit delta